MEEAHPRKAAISGEVSASAWPCRELWSVNYTIYPTENLWITQELAQPKGKGVSLLLLNQSVNNRAGEGRECRVLSSQPLSVLCVCVYVCVCVCVLGWGKSDTSSRLSLWRRSWGLRCWPLGAIVHRNQGKCTGPVKGVWEQWNMNICNINQENFTDPHLCWLCLFIIGVGQ